MTHFALQHKGDVERAKAASQERDQALEEVAQLTQSLSEFLEAQANMLQNHINSDATVRALGSDAVSVVRSAVNGALELGKPQDSVSPEGSVDEHAVSTVISSLSATNDVATAMLSMYAEIDLMGVSVERATQHGNISEELQVRSRYAHAERLFVTVLARFVVSVPLPCVASRSEDQLERCRISVQKLQSSLDQAQSEQERLQHDITAEQAKSEELEAQHQQAETNWQAKLDQASAEMAAAQGMLQEHQSDWALEKLNFLDTISLGKEEAQKLSESLHNARELNTDLSEQCSQAKITMLSQEATIKELQATAYAQVNEIGSLGSAYAMKAQALEDMQAEKHAAEKTIASNDSELLESANEIAALKVGCQALD